jgi:hypothetical protein
VSECPDIDELVSLRPGGAAAAHVEACGACGAVVALATFRAGGARTSERPETCAAFEPAMAALVDGTLGAERLAELIEHLGRCGACNDLAARLTLARGELDDVPEPEIEAKWGDARIVEATGVREVTEVAPKPAPKPLPGSRWRRAAPWVAAVACGVGIGLIGAALIFTRPIAPNASAPPVAASASSLALPGGALVPPPLVDNGATDPRSRSVDAEARLAAAERMAREAQERAELAEYRARLAEAELRAMKEGHVASTPSVFEAPKSPALADVSFYCAPSCDVTDNGRPFGTSPIHHKQIAPGNHQFVLTNGEVTKRFSFTLSPGDRITENVDMKSYR